MRSESPILVTGAAGLIGRRVTELLVQAGRAVIATDRAAPAQPLGCEFAAAELSDGMRLTALVARRPAAILHCGGISGQMLAKDNPASILSINAGGTGTLLELARLFGVSRFVFCSSVHAYGDTPQAMDPVTEDAPLAAREVYGASKVAAEAALRAYALEHGIQACALRLGWVYGPRRTTPSLTARMVRDAAMGRAVTQVEHDGRYAVPLLHVEDAAAALLAALDAPQVLGRCYNIVGGPSQPFNAIAEMISAVRPNWRAEFTAGKALPEYRQGHFCTRAAAQDLGWAPRVTPQQGLADYIGWLEREAF
ncbi:NAD(P)-dependent oxidoreductase [Sediminicoccus sp. KRV36]|uniref:NAD-dependent epimerase/dehydratase family protein n=1 Tax=Sediminicoccus sp. KRV36 TaxID=3133721 RepID=UPI00200C6D9D|nr:NAD(P)-dependent oxidoreductase [Sediminicoccus rosea]UPY38750.1 NAD(P)-dependent oxidoreductase [Sediminicoccus rosea]